MRLAAAIVSGWLALLSPSSAVSQGAEPFAGKTITLYCACGVGSGYDFIARLFARHFGRHMPGNPNVVVSNMQGGLGLPAANLIYNVAPKDGTAIGALLQNVAEEQVLGPENIRYDASKFGWIGRLAPNVEIAYVWNTVPVKTFDDLRRRETIFAVNGPSALLYPTLLNNLAGTKIKMVRGYGPTPVVHLALQRGEVEGMTGSLGVIKTLEPTWMPNKTVTLLMQYQHVRHPELPDVPTALEFVADGEDKEIFGFFINSATIGRAFLAPPGLPPERLAMLREGFAGMLEDPEFLAEVKQAKHDIAPLSGLALQALVEKQLSVSSAIRTRIQAMGLHQ
jgi:tripartite-type tricarboxylate transporter receptor subunit TctC